MAKDTVLHRRLNTRFEKALSAYSLIEDGDRVLIGLSGGKDSLLLTEMLARRSRVFRPRFSVEAAHIRMSHIDYRTSTAYLERFCRELDVPLHVLTTDFDASTDTRKRPCFLCSWYRRKELFALARRLECNKIALGHHQDDIIHTYMLNMFFQGRSSTMPVRLKMDKMPITIIRPLCLEREADIKEYASEAGYEKQEKLCPYEAESNRRFVADMFSQIEAANPEAASSVWHALESSGSLLEDSVVNKG